MKEKDINKKINIIKENNKNRVQFIIFLFCLIIILYILIYTNNMFNGLKDFLLVLLIIIEIIFLIFNILIIINNNKLRKLIFNKKNYFNEKIQISEDININDFILKKDKSLSREEIDRIDIFSKDNRIVNSNNLIEGKYNDLFFKSYDIEIKDNKDTYTGKWIILDTLIKDNISTYICNKDNYIKDLVYPKNIFEDYKDKDNKVLVKNKNELLNVFIELRKELKKDIYISIINSNIQILIFNNIEVEIEEEIKVLNSYLEIIYKYKDLLMIEKLEVI